MYSNGLFWCALINSVRPGTIDLTKIELPVHPERTCRDAFAAAEMKLGIPAVLDPIEFAAGGSDILSVQLFIAFFRDYATKNNVVDAPANCNPKSWSHIGSFVLSDDDWSSDEEEEEEEEAEISRGRVGKPSEVKARSRSRSRSRADKVKAGGKKKKVAPAVRVPLILHECVVCH